MQFRAILPTKKVCGIFNPAISTFVSACLLTISSWPMAVRTWWASSLVKTLISFCLLHSVYKKLALAPVSTSTVTCVHLNLIFVIALAFCFLLYLSLGYLPVQQSSVVFLFLWLCSFCPAISGCIRPLSWRCRQSWSITRWILHSRGWEWYFHAVDGYWASNLSWLISSGAVKASH